MVWTPAKVKSVGIFIAGIIFSVMYALISTVYSNLEKRIDAKADRDEVAAYFQDIKEDMKILKELHLKDKRTGE